MSDKRGKNLGAEWGRKGPIWVRERFGFLLGIPEDERTPWKDE